MTPEREEELAVMDLSYSNSELKGDIEYWRAPKGERLRVTWDAQRQPKNYAPIHDGVASYFVNEDWKPDFVEPYPSPPTVIENSRYRWGEGGFKSGIPSMMMILILPHNYTLSDPSPMPIGAKEYDGRLALYWIPVADSEGRAEVLFTLKEFKGDLVSEVRRIDKSRSSIPSSSPIDVDRKEPETEEVPSWFSVAGVVFGAITMIFLMLLIILSLFGREIPTSSRFIVVSFLALSVGLSSTFLGGTAAARGRMSLPFFKESPMSFAATGGIAAFIIVLVLGYVLYVR